MISSFKILCLDSVPRVQLSGVVTMYKSPAIAARIFLTSPPTIDNFFFIFAVWMVVHLDLVLHIPEDTRIFRLKNLSPGQNKHTQSMLSDITAKVQNVSDKEVKNLVKIMEGKKRILP